MHDTTKPMESTEIKKMDKSISYNSELIPFMNYRQLCSLHSLELLLCDGVSCSCYYPVVFALAAVPQ